MAKIELKMPKMGESIIEATILKWTKQIGDEIEQEETVLEIATDKVDSEVPAPVDGTLSEIKFQEGDVVPVGEVIALIETEVEQDESGNGYNPVEETEMASAVPFVPARHAVKEQVSSDQKDDLQGRFYSPLVLNIARKEGISMQELESVPGSGRSGRVTKKDMLHYVKNRGVTPHHLQQPIKTQETVTEQKKSLSVSNKSNTETASRPLQVQEKKFAHTGNFEIEEMDRMRKMIAENMLYSTHISAHVTSFVEADVTGLVRWRKKVKDNFFDKYGEKLTFTPLFVQSVAQALREYPRVNASIEGDKIYLKKDINIGIAVALANDNLIVPVIKNADRMNLVGLTAAVNDLVLRARSNKLKAEELEGGTYTLSNVGTFGNVMGTPIIMQPQVAILAVGAIRKIPAVLETDEGDMIAIRQKMFLSHSYDHRIIDGALGGRFVQYVADTLAAWDHNTSV